MTLTNFPGGISSFGVPVGGMFTNGKPWFVKPGTDAGGNDGNTGDGVDVPLATLVQAQAFAAADRNDVVYLIASSNTAANTSDAQSSTLLWAKDAVHLIGVNAGNCISQRSRISVASTATGASVAPLMTVSADNCRIENIQVISELASANAKGGLLVSGDRNHFVNCHFGGAATTTQDVAGAYSLRVTGSENLFDDCTIGIDTITRATATYEMSMGGAATRNIFRNCRIITYAGHNTMTWLTTDTTIDRFALFENCIFINAVNSAATTMNQGFGIGHTGGAVILKNCTLLGATASETAASGYVWYDAATSVKAVATAVA
jgi:hypothetical protein